MNRQVCFVAALLAAVCVALSINQASAQACENQFKTTQTCFTQLKAKSDRESASEQRNLEQRKQALRAAAQKCLQQNGCSVDPTDPKYVATKECLKKSKTSIQQKMAACMSKKGNGRFSPDVGEQEQRGRANPADDRIDVRAAAHACETQKKQKGIARKVQSCVRAETEKTKTPGGSGSSSVLQTFSKFNSYCNDKKACSAKLNAKCTTDICACYKETVVSQQVVGEFKSCMSNQLKSANADADAENADDLLLQSTRYWYPFCTPQGEDDSCDKEKGVVPDVIKSLKGGSGANNALLDAFSSNFGNANLDIGSLTKILSAGSGGNPLGGLLQGFTGRRR